MDTNNWKLDLFSALDTADSLRAVIDASLKVIKPLGLDFCGWRMASPDAPQGLHVSIVSSDDPAHRMESARQYDDSPCSRHCARSTAPFSWLGTTDDDAFQQAPELFESYYALGHYAGWARSIIDEQQRYNMFYAESSVPFSAADMEYIEQHMQWVFATTFIRINELPDITDNILTPIQCQILSLYARGHHRLEEIADVMHRPLACIKSELDHTLTTLGCQNIAMAVARAIFLRLLN